MYSGIQSRSKGRDDVKQEELGAIVLTIVFACYGIKSVVEIVAASCIEVIRVVTANAPWIGFFAIVAILLLVLRYKFDEGIELFGSFFRK
jgi:hypothetical protein